jgi:hypothetical protein
VDQICYYNKEKDGLKLKCLWYLIT